MAESQLQLRFKRNDIWSTVTTHRGTLRILPAGKKSRQKVAIGDTTGVVNCFGVGKHHELKPEFSTPRPPQAAEVTRIDLFKDQIFVATANRIAAYTKKGKPFFVNETSLSEPIKHMRINTPFLCTGGEYVVTEFQEVTDKGFFFCPDRINDLVVIPRDDAGNIDMYVGLQDRTIRCLRHSQLRHQMGCEAPVTAVTLNVKDPDTMMETPLAGRDLVYGTQTGSVGGLRATPEGLARRFSAVPKSQLAHITAITCADINQTGLNDIAIGRDNGGVEVHSFERNADGTPIVAWTSTVNEYITSLDVGNVTHAERLEIVLATFSGKVITFSINDEDAATQAVVPQALGSAPAALPATAQEAVRQGGVQTQGDQGDPVAITRAKMDETMQAIAELKKQLQARKNEFAGQDPSSSKRVASEKLRAVAPTFTMKEKIHLDEHCIVVVGVELDTVLDNVAIASFVDCEVINDASSSDDVRVSVTKPSYSPGSKAKLLAVYKCPADSTTTRLEMHLRPTEGQQGEVHLYVTPKTQPRSVLKRVVEIPPLSLHLRQAEPDTNDNDPTADPTLSLIRVTGPFSIKDAHAWMYRAFFDIPQNIMGEEGRLTFRNVFSGTMLYVRYRKGEIDVYSHNVSALATFRDFVTKEAARRKIQVALDSRQSNESVNVVLRALDAEITVQSKRARAAKVLDALKELQTQEPDVSFLAPEYRDILAASEQNGEKSTDAQTKRMHHLLNVLERLLQDRTSFRGGNQVSPQRIQEMHHLVANNYSLTALMNFFAQQ